MVIDYHFLLKMMMPTMIDHRRHVHDFCLWHGCGYLKHLFDGLSNDYQSLVESFVDCKILAFFKPILVQITYFDPLVDECIVAFCGQDWRITTFIGFKAIGPNTHLFITILDNLSIYQPEIGSTDVLLLMETF